MSTKFYLETYGCSLNMADSDLIVGRLHQLGAERADAVAESEIIILNTCGVKEPTEDKIIHRLEELADGTIPVIVTGCLPRISLKRVRRAHPRFAAILGPQSLDSLGSVYERVLAGERGIVHLDSDQSPKLQYYEGPPSSVICTIPICEGCVGDCAYCAVKFARSDVKSYSIDDILSVVKRCIHTGYKEIRLTAQDAGAFGIDSNEKLSHLLSQVSNVEGTHRFRLGMFNPNLVMDNLQELLGAMKSERFFRFFHVPLQSGSDRILQSMNRKYSVDEWKFIVSEITNQFPDATIATDIIVGFPGETDEDFNATLDIIQELKPGVINVSKYGDRPGTRASKAQNKVKTDIKKERSRQLSSLVTDIITKKNKGWLEWQGPVLVTNPATHGGLLGRTPSYKPVIINDKATIGDLVTVRITAAGRTHLTGSIV